MHCYGAGKGVGASYPFDALERDVYYFSVVDGRSFSCLYSPIDRQTLDLAIRGLSKQDALAGLET